MNLGNLQEILKFIFNWGGDFVFKEHVDNAATSVTYRSKTTQNEIIAVCNEMISAKLLNEVKEAQFFSELADEAVGINNTEQMPLVVRFVDKSCQILEEFMGFIEEFMGFLTEGLKQSSSEARRNCGPGTCPPPKKSYRTTPVTSFAKAPF